MKKFLLSLLVLFSVGFAQQERVAIINTVDDGDSIKPSDLTYLTDRLRGAAVKALPKQRYGVMTTESIVAFLGSQERAQKECKEASCLAELGRKVSADYVAQARIGRFNKNFTIKAELYSSKSGVMVGSFTGDSKSLQGLLDLINKEAPLLFKELSDVSGSSSAVSPIVADGINNLEDRRDGKKYKTIVIGKQTWMAENLNYNASDSKCYNNKKEYCDKYGRLYDWSTALAACPSGWHLPSKEEWGLLTATVGGEKTAGKYLKATNGWNKNGNGEDKFGFSALPGGLGNSDGDFYYVGYYGYWWSASEIDSSGANLRTMYYYGEDVYWDYGDKDYLFSVRCLQD